MSKIWFNFWGPCWRCVGGLLGLFIWASFERNVGLWFFMLQCNGNIDSRQSIQPSRITASKHNKLPSIWLAFHIRWITLLGIPARTRPISAVVMKRRSHQHKTRWPANAEQNWRHTTGKGKKTSQPSETFCITASIDEHLKQPFVHMWAVAAMTMELWYQWFLQCSHVNFPIR